MRAANDLLHIAAKRWIAAPEVAAQHAGDRAPRPALQLARPVPEIVNCSADPLHEPANEGAVLLAMTTVLPFKTAAANLDESQLTAGFVAGDRAAFSELVTRYERQVFYVVWRYVRNDEDAKDLVQATFVKAWQNAATFRGDSSVRTWLYRIGVNLALNYVRDHGKWHTESVKDDAASAEPNAAERIANAEEGRQLRQAVEELPAKQRLVVELRVQEGLSFREVADVAECSEDAAKANFHHAIKRLRSLISGDRSRASEH